MTISPLFALVALRRRRDAALRLPPLPSGHHDPDWNHQRPMITPSTALYVASIGGALTREAWRAAWYAFPDHRGMLDAYGAANFGTQEVAA